MYGSVTAEGKQASGPAKKFAQTIKLPVVKSRLLFLLRPMEIAVCPVGRRPGPRPFVHTRQRNAKATGSLLPRSLFGMFGEKAKMK